MKKREIALLGGAFNPITRGHIQIAEFVLKNLRGCDEVWFMPCFDHVYHKEMVHSSYRLKMCELAADKFPEVRVFDYEVQEEASAGTYFLMQKLLEEDFSQKYNYSIIIGQDNANTFTNWLYHDKLEKLVPFIVVPRKGIAVVPGNAWYKNPPHCYLNENSIIMEVSSTLVRSLLKENRIEKVKEYIDPCVLAFILENRLYR